MKEATLLNQINTNSFENSNSPHIKREIKMKEDIEWKGTCFRRASQDDASMLVARSMERAIRGWGGGGDCFGHERTLKINWWELEAQEVDGLTAFPLPFQYCFARYGRWMPERTPYRIFSHHTRVMNRTLIINTHFIPDSSPKNRIGCWEVRWGTQSISFSLSHGTLVSQRKVDEANAKSATSVDFKRKLGFRELLLIEG